MFYYYYNVIISFVQRRAWAFTEKKIKKKIRNKTRYWSSFKKNKTKQENTLSTMKKARKYVIDKEKSKF